MTSLPPADKWHSLRNMWLSTAPYVVPTGISAFAASSAIVIPFYGFMAKTDKQLGKPIPPWSRLALVKGIKAAPTIGVTVATQIATQKVFEELFKKSLEEKNQKFGGFVSMVGSALAVGAISAPTLAAFNAQTAGRGVLESLRGLSIKQTGAIMTREASFLLSVRISDPLGEKMRQLIGDNKGVEYASTFASGAIGSVIGHPADTALTMWQEGLKIQSLRQLMRGGSIKAGACGFFTVGYKAVKELLGHDAYGLENEQQQ
jgi:hypothetical protein